MITAVGYGPIRINGENRSMTEFQGDSWVDLPQHASIQVSKAHLFVRKHNTSLRVMFSRITSAVLDVTISAHVMR